VHNVFLVSLHLSVSTCFGRLWIHHQEKQLCLCDSLHLLFCVDDCLVCILRKICAPSWFYLQDSGLLLFLQPRTARLCHNNNNHPVVFLLYCCPYFCRNPLFYPMACVLMAFKSNYKFFANLGVSTVSLLAINFSSFCHHLIDPINLIVAPCIFVESLQFINQLMHI